MRAIEAFCEIDQEGRLHLQVPSGMEGQKVKVIILIPESEELEENLWLKEVGRSESFDFLRDEEEDVYTVEDGKPVDYGK